MKLSETKTSKKALEKIKKKIIEKFENKDDKRIKIKFTKKKEFIAVPIPYNSPAFQLYLNNNFLKSFFLIKGKWKEI